MHEAVSKAGKVLIIGGGFIGVEVGEMVNLIVMVIQDYLTASEMDTLQIGARPFNLNINDASANTCCRGCVEKDVKFPNF